MRQQQQKAFLSDLLNQPSGPAEGASWVSLFQIGRTFLLHRAKVLVKLRSDFVDPGCYPSNIQIVFQEWEGSPPGNNQEPGFMD